MRKNKRGLIPYRSLLGLLDSLVEVEIAQLLRRVLRYGHLVVVEDHPLAVLQDVAHVVTDLGRTAHVGDKCHQFVFCKAKR